MLRQRPHLILFVCAVLAVPARAAQEGFGASAQPSGIPWLHDLEAAKATAKQTGRLVLVHFWTPTCQPCMALEQNVFNQFGVAGALEAQFVPVKLNANDHAAVAQAYGITRVPTDVVITPEGQVVGKLISPPTPGAYVADLSQVARQHVTRTGHFAQVSELAPVAPKLNAAYAHLHVAPNVAPAAPLQTQITPPGQIGAAGTATQIGSPIANTAVAPTTATPMTNPFVSPQSPSGAVAAASPSAPGPAITTNDRYAQASTAAAMPVMSPPPAQVANPYVTPPAINAMPVSVNQGTIAPSASATDAVPMGVPDLRALPPNAPPLGFDGYCPVSMRNQWKWVPGDPRWGIVHRGRTYWFAGPTEQQQFWADPDRYSPALSGMDPVMAIDHQQQVPGKREHSIDYDNLFYMFASEATLQQFTATPERYATSVRQAMGIPRGRLVR